MLEARSLTKYYSHTPAVRQVSFTVRPGEILGYLGPNGAGKSTTVKMLTGLIEPSEGQIFYRGQSVYENFTAFQRRIGYVPEEAHLYPHLSGREFLRAFTPAAAPSSGATRSPTESGIQRSAPKSAGDAPRNSFGPPTRSCWFSC